MNFRKFLRALLGIHNLEVRILMALNDATARLTSSISTLGIDVAAQLDAISAEIQQVANAIADGNTDGLEAQLNALADQVDGISTKVTDSTSQLAADDAAAPPAPVDPNAPV